MLNSRLQDNAFTISFRDANAEDSSFSTESSDDGSTSDNSLGDVSMSGKRVEGDGESESTIGGLVSVVLGPSSNALRCCIKVGKFPSDQKSTMNIVAGNP